MGQMLFPLLISTAWLTGVSIATDDEPPTLDLFKDCTDYKSRFERVYTVPGEAAMLNSTLVDGNVFDFHREPYNITWYDPKTGLELTGETGRTMIRGEALWFLNSTMEDNGHYLSVIRTAERCFKQSVVLVVNRKRSGECGRPLKTIQWITALVNGILVCPLQDQMGHVDHFSIQWSKDCDVVEEGEKFEFQENNRTLKIRDVIPDDKGFYTCTMTFDIGGVTSFMAETINCEVNEYFSLSPEMKEPGNYIIKVQLGSPFSKTCRVFVPGSGVQTVFVIWISQDHSISDSSKERIHQGPPRETVVENGVLLERSLNFSEVREEDLKHNFTCQVVSARGMPSSVLQLQPADPDLRLPIGLFMVTLALVFIAGVVMYRTFKIEIILWFRSTFPFLYASTEHDGKQYDAYVAYPRLFGGVASGSAEMFALKTLPLILEGCYGYKLFILGRDSLPGEAVVDVVEENMAACRRLLLLYSASSLCSPQAVEWMEQQTGLHRALLEETLRVVLVELEEVADPSLLPESVRLLRERQGALRAWRRSSRWWWWRSGMEGWKEEEGGARMEEEGVSLASLSPPVRFWKELRYHLPVRGKARPGTEGGTSCSTSERHTHTHTHTLLPGEEDKHILREKCPAELLRGSLI